MENSKAKVDCKELVVYSDYETIHVLDNIVTVCCIKCIVRPTCVYNSFYMTGNDFDIKRYYLSISKPCDVTTDYLEHLSKIGIIGPKHEFSNKTTIRGAVIYQVE